MAARSAHRQTSNPTVATVGEGERQAGPHHQGPPDRSDRAQPVTNAGAARGGRDDRPGPADLGAAGEADRPDADVVGHPVGQGGEQVAEAAVRGAVRAHRDVDGAVPLQLGWCERLTEARNVVLLGPAGTGKAHLATALGTSGWGGVFGDQAVAAAMVDRIVHHAGVLTPQRRQLPPPRTRHRQAPKHQKPNQSDQTHTEPVASISSVALAPDSTGVETNEPL